LIADSLGRPSPAYPNGHVLAEKARFLVRDFAALVRTNRAADPEMLREGRRLFPHLFNGDAGDRVSQIFQHQVNFLQVAARLPAIEKPSRKSPVPTKPRMVAKVSKQQKEKEFAYV
jgi:hypothetical protein